MRKSILVLTSLIIYHSVYAGITEQQSTRKEIRQGNIVLARYDRELTDHDLHHNLPPALLAWQEWVSTDEEMTTSTDHVDPLLSTEWGQDEPYNLLCPVIRDTLAPTGCVATAMAQVLFYWQEYVSGYDWSQILTNYTNLWGQQATKSQQNAVAQLMVDCGRSVDMSYGPQSSGASTLKVVPAMVNKYGFSHCAHFVYRPYMSYAEWAELLRDELRAHRPIIYRGISSSSSHAFVIDGFNEEGFFHVNWGWEGRGNGWFRFTALNPANKGTGGGTSKDGYNYQQGMIVNMAPAAVLHSDPSPVLYVDSMSCAIGIDGMDSITLRGIKNMTGDTLRGQIAFALCHNGQFISRVRNSSFTYAPACNMIRRYSGFYFDDLTPGDTYELIAEWQQKNTKEWQPLISTLGQPVKRTFTAISDSEVKWDARQPIMGHPLLTSQENTTFACGHFASFNTTWTTDESEWNGWITVALENKDYYKEIYTGGVDLCHGQIDTILIQTNTIHAPAGRYALRWGYYTGNLTGLVWLDHVDSISVISPNTVNELYYDNYTIADTLLTLTNPYLDITLGLHHPEQGTEQSIFSGDVGLGVYYANYPESTDRLWTLMVQPMVVVYQDTLTYHHQSDLANNLPEGRYRIMVRSRATGKERFNVNSSSAPIYVTIQHIKTASTEIESTNLNDTKKVWQNGHLYILRDGHRYSVLGMPISKL